ncbi:AAA family ATPase [Streptomyces sp. NPDC102406]|uniref:AAA family ATPase n=1 Tax=Streptomyces sp. NPDC102406 TaxID=3366171 RepID=UPI0038226CB8
MPTLHLTQGLPAAGKSTLARKLIADSPTPIRYVGLDALRLMLDAQTPTAWWAGGAEESTARAQAALVGQLLADGADVLVDGTHTAPRQLAALREVVDGWPLTVIVHRVGTGPAVCAARDGVRVHPIGSACIGRLAAEWAAAEAAGWRLTGEWLTGVREGPVSGRIAGADRRKLPQVGQCWRGGMFALPGTAAEKHSRAAQERLNPPCWTPSGGPGARSAVREPYRASKSSESYRTSREEPDD